jgi:large subunit ribosomal protein L9
MMKVILTEEVANVGQAGQVVEVAPGYARNYLLPRKLAIEATKGNVKSLQHHRRGIESRQKKLAQGAQALGERITRTPITIAARAGETGRLYGSVTAADVAQEIQRALKIEVDKRKVEIPEPIKVLGEHEVKVRLHRDVQVTATVAVVPEAAPAEEAAAERPAAEAEAASAAAAGAQETDASTQGDSEPESRDETAAGSNQT